MADNPSGIYRTITMTACNGQKVDAATNEFVDVCEVIPRRVNATQASRILRKQYKDPTITINNVAQTTQRYGMGLETFMQYATEL